MTRRIRRWPHGAPIVALKRFRDRPAVNRGGRRVIKLLDRTAAAGKRHWPVSGDVPIDLLGTPLRVTATNDNLVTAAYYGALSETAELRLWKALLPGTGTVLDIGANYGPYTLMAAKLRPTVRVIAFEPHPGCAASLRRNVQLNRLSNVVVEELAASDRPGVTALTIAAGGRGSEVSSLNGAFSRAHYGVPFVAHEVITATIDDYLEARPEDVRVSLIKIDTESHELAVLRGARGVIARDRPPIVCEIVDPELFAAFHPGLSPQDFGHRVDDISELIAELGYHPLAISRFGLHRVDRIAQTAGGIGNYLLVPDRIDTAALTWSEIDAGAISRQASC